jgi:copper(I)-binding protein
MRPPLPRRQHASIPTNRFGWLLAASLFAACAAHAHDFKVGAITIDHPYAVPSAAGSTLGGVYVRALNNGGDAPDRLLGALSPAAASVQIRRSAAPGDLAGAVDAGPIELPPRSELPLRHDGSWHLVLVGLKQPLVDGQRFPVTLRFERAGEKQFTVSVQTPRASAPR